MKHSIKIIASITLLAIASLLYSAASVQKKINESKTSRYVKFVHNQQIPAWKSRLANKSITPQKIKAIQQEISLAIAALIDRLTHTETIWDLPLDAHRIILKNMAMPLINHLHDMYPFEQYRIKPRDPIQQASFSLDSKLIITRAGSEIQIWNAQDGGLIGTIKQSIKKFVLNPQDKTQIATIADNNAYIWNIQTKELLKTFAGHQNSINDIAFSPDGTRIITGSRDNTAKLWNTETEEPLCTFAGHQGAITCVAFSPDGTVVATGSVDHSAKIWNIITKEEQRTVAGNYNRAINRVEFNTNNILLTVSHGRAIMWNIQTGKIIQHFKSQNLREAAFSPDGTLIGICGAYEGCYMYTDLQNIENAYLLYSFNQGIEDKIVFSPNGKFIITTSEDCATIKNAQTGTLINTLKLSEIRSASFSPDQSRIVFVINQIATGTNAFAAVYGAPQQFIQWIKNRATIDQIAFLASALDVPGATAHKLTKAEVWLLFSDKKEDEKGNVIFEGTGMEDTMKKYYPGLFGWVTTHLPISIPMK